jgi:hypothetical protein
VNSDPGTQIATAPLAPAPDGHEPTDGTLSLPDPLPALVAEFPAFRIWRESICGRVRFIACRLHPDLHPHTVITADLDELRAALAPSLAAGQNRP